MHARTIHTGLRAVLELFAHPANASIVDTVRLVTGPLVGHHAGPFAFEFQFNDGSGIGDGNNTAILSDSIFDTGGPVGFPSTFGNVTSDLKSCITMINSFFFNEFIQFFTPGATLSFQMNLSGTVNRGGVPDESSFSILDSSGAELPTLRPANAFLLATSIPTPPTPATFPTHTNQIPNAGGIPISIAAPQATRGLPDVPEPGTGRLLTVILAIVVSYHRKFRLWNTPS